MEPKNLLRGSQNSPSSIQDEIAALRQTRLSVAIDLPKRPWSILPAGTIENVGPGGLFVAAVPLRSGRIVDLEFSVAGFPDPFRITGKVRWIRGADLQTRRSPPGTQKSVGMGIEFLRFNQGRLEDLLHASQHLARLQEKDRPLVHLSVVPEEMVPSENQSMIVIRETAEDGELDQAFARLFADEV